MLLQPFFVPRTGFLQPYNSINNKLWVSIGCRNSITLTYLHASSQFPLSGQYREFNQMTPQKIIFYFAPSSFVVCLRWRAPVKQPVP